MYIKSSVKNLQKAKNILHEKVTLNEVFKLLSSLERAFLPNLTFRVKQDC